MSSAEITTSNPVEKRSSKMGKIIRAEIFKLKYDLSGYKLSYGTVYEAFPVLLILTDSEGRVGYGEANPERPFTKEDADDVIAALKNRLLPIVLREENVDPSHIEELLGQDEPDEDLMAKGAINIALMDLQGKRLGVPVAELLGKVVRRSLDVSHPLNNGTADDDIRIIDAKLKEGYRHYMLKMGMSAYPIAGEITRVTELQKRYGDSITIKVDANTGWSREQAREFLDGVPDYPIFVEQPIDKHDIDGMAELQKNTKLLVSADESLTGMASAMEILEKGAARIFSIKVSKNGGILTAQAIAKLAERNGILCYPNSMLEGGITQAASLHLISTLTNLVDAGGSYRSVLRLSGDATNFHTFIRDGVVYLPEGPGLGIEVDEKKVRSTALASYLVE